MKDCKGNKVEIGTKLKSTQTSNDVPTIKCIGIKRNIAKFRFLTFEDGKEFVLDKKNLANGKWTVILPS